MESISINKQEARMLVELFSFLATSRTVTVDRHLSRLCASRAYRLQILHDGKKLYRNLMATEKYDYAERVWHLRECAKTIFNETEVKETLVEPYEPVQSYLTECPVRLRRNRTANLSYYDNQRSSTYRDRYYFGKYGQFLE